MRMDDLESGMAALVENLQRQDLDFIEEAQGIRCLLDRFDMSQEQAARLLGKSQSSVANKLRLLRHSPAVLEALRSAGLTERHARALLRLPDEASVLAAIQEIVRQNMSVARTERYIESLLRHHRPHEKQRRGTGRAHGRDAAHRGYLQFRPLPLSGYRPEHERS